MFLTSELAVRAHLAVSIELPHYDALSFTIELCDLRPDTEWNELGTVSGDLEGDS